MENNSLSPQPPVNVVEPQETMDFPEAMRELIKGNRITRLSWDPAKDEYGILADGWLSLHKSGEFKQWLVNDGDLLGTDWIVI